jgi:hypothetical protein
MRDMRDAHTILLGEPEWKRLRGRIRHRWEDNVRMDLRMNRRWEGVDWIHLAEDRDQWWAVKDMVKNLWVQ